MDIRELMAGARRSPEGMAALARDLVRHAIAQAARSTGDAPDVVADRIDHYARALREAADPTDPTAVLVAAGATDAEAREVFPAVRAVMMLGQSAREVL